MKSFLVPHQLAIAQQDVSSSNLICLALQHAGNRLSLPLTNHPLCTNHGALSRYHHGPALPILPGDIPSTLRGH